MPIDADNKRLKDHLFELCYYLEDLLDCDTSKEQALLYESLLLLESMNLNESDKKHFAELAGACYHEWKWWTRQTTV